MGPARRATRPPRRRPRRRDGRHVPAPSVRRPAVRAAAVRRPRRDVGRRLSGRRRPGRRSPAVRPPPPRDPTPTPTAASTDGPGRRTVRGRGPAGSPDRVRAAGPARRRAEADGCRPGRRPRRDRRPPRGRSGPCQERCRGQCRGRSRRGARASGRCRAVRAARRRDGAGTSDRSPLRGGRGRPRGDRRTPRRSPDPRTGHHPAGGRPRGVAGGRRTCRRSPHTGSHRRSRGRSSPQGHPCCRPPTQYCHETREAVVTSGTCGAFVTPSMGGYTVWSSRSPPGRSPSPGCRTPATTRSTVTTGQHVGHRCHSTGHRRSLPRVVTAWLQSLSAGRHTADWCAWPVRHHPPTGSPPGAPTARSGGVHGRTPFPRWPLR